MHGLDLDTEVDYSVKVHASFADVDAAVYLRCFDLDTERRRCAEHGPALLALALLGDATSLTLDEAVTAVTDGPEQATGKDFLGYIPGLHVTATLRRGLGRLARQGIVRDLDGTRFEPDHGVRRTVIRKLRAARGPRAPAWDDARWEGGLTQ